MDNLLIDFDSPKLRKGDAFLIPHCLNGSSFVPSNVMYPVTGDESNPFDLVVGQVAAKTAAENDPFEMVLNDAISHQEQENKEVVKVGKSAVPCDSPESLDRNSRRSISLPDLRQCNESVSPCNSANQNSLSPKDALKSVPQTSVTEDYYVCSSNYESAEWSCLDDIPPPDALLNATMDMTCFLDDTLSMNSPQLPLMKHSLSADLLRKRVRGVSSDIESLSINDSDKATHKSEDELKLLAQKKIENIISKAELEVRSDIQNSILHKRLSIDTMSKPSQEILALCTPRKTRDSHSKSVEVPALSFQKWSESELRKLDLILPDSAPKVKASSTVHFPELYKEEIKFFTDKGTISAEGMLMADLAVLPPLHQGSPKEKYADNTTSYCDQAGPSHVEVSSPTSPALRPLPLCEDAVRNLSLCSKYSPGPSSSLNKNKTDVRDTTAAAASNQVKLAKQAKLTVRKPVSSKTQPKMAPMKATAPIQNMTRTKLSVGNPPKSEAGNSSTSVNNKSVFKETITKPVATENTRVRLPQSPSRALSGSLPNLSTPGSKLPSRLPSPRRASGVLHEPVNLKRRLDAMRDKSMPPISSPRPHRQNSPCKSGTQSRVLAEINSCSGARKSPKRRTSQMEVPKRSSRSILGGKENLI
ncbi:hypothetical protein ONE63_003659 [Megalurothrips usitatus]|uniref:Uncharacterized protein n=1 Tax=Megalurothrips usitatus TaxID=439358 RepID=A0AAV7X3N6_9NEOP|nr:hypothetical protein ONE63_003659 [Megalurothrips usitatus]